MITLTTSQGKRIVMISERDLRSPVSTGERVRAYCHIHGSDHQRSLSISRATGWGHCFNAACDVTVLVAEWNREASNRLLRMDQRRTNAVPQPFPRASTRLSTVQPMLFPPPRVIPQWQQEERAALLELAGQMRQALYATMWARIYLRERGIPLMVAQAAGVGYLPVMLLREPGMREARRLLGKWVDRFVFPLQSPEGTGYIGRSLWGWQPGMNETTHKQFLEQKDGPKRWIKTNPAGWFGEAWEQVSRTIVVVEGAFDRLTLLAAGLAPADVIALVGTAAPVDWLPVHVHAVALALDGDEGGRQAGFRLARQLVLAGIRVKLSPCPQDQRGKDWNERWQQEGERMITPLTQQFSLWKRDTQAFFV